MEQLFTGHDGLGNSLQRGAELGHSAADVNESTYSATPHSARQIASMSDDFFHAWRHAQWQSLSLSLSDDAVLRSSQHGEGQGLESWRQLLLEDALHLVRMRTSNHATVVGKDGRAASSAYVYGLLGHGVKRFLFGATVVLRFEFRNARWLLATALIGVNWCKGDLELVDHWSKPPADTGWEPGDSAPTIVSELDSPWAYVGDVLPHEPEQAVRELYSKYSFAIDQGDIALLSDCYTDDAAGGFTPLGPLRGRRAIVGQLKSFRRLWPWMQHFADVVRVEFEPDGQHAQMIVARIIPERALDAQGNVLYGAHYQIRARREADGEWRICWSDYRPGWFTCAELPEFEIGVTHA
jgi:ketosteroid isomerase-like protein